MALELNKVNVSYGKRNILQDISLSFSTGLTYIIGLNGSGKTTLFRAISGAMPYAGSILLEGQEIKESPQNDIARKLSLVRQLLQVPFPVKVWDFVLMGRYPYLGWLGNYSLGDKKIANRYLEELEIAHFKDRTLDQLSGGERQKVMIARALCQETSVILLDEPAQSLDPLNQEAIYLLIENLAAAGKCVLCTTHDELPLLNPEANVIALQNGQVIYQHKGGIPMNDLKEKVYRKQNG